MPKKKGSKLLPVRLCETCGKTYQPSRTWQLYCSDGCRIEAQKETRYPEYICAYCGLIGDVVDYVPPLYVRSAIAQLPYAKHFPFVEVRACRECSGALAPQDFWTVAERKAYVKEWLKIRYRAALAMPDWTDAEYAQLGPNLRAVVSSTEAVRDVVRKRLAW